MKTIVNYVAPPTVARFMQSDAPVRLIMGPIGGGKTTGALLEIARRAQMQAPSRDGIRRTRWIVVRNTYQMLRDSTLASFREWFPPGVAGTWKESEMKFTLQFGDVHAEVLFRALDDPDDVRRLLSLEGTGALVDECKEIPLEIITALRSRLGRYPSAKEGGPTWHGLILVSNPPSTDHWIYEKFEVEKPEGWEIFKQPGGLDPNAENKENLPPRYYEDLMDGADQEWINVYIHAQYGRSKEGMPVYASSWKTDFHTRTGLQVITSSPVVIGLDAGRTPAAAFLQMDARGRVLLLDELTSENMGMENFIAQKIKPLLNQRYMGIPAVVAADPAVWQKSQLNELSVADIIKKAGLTLPRPRGPAMGNRIEPRLRAVEAVLNRQVEGEAMFLVDKDRCPMIVAGFEHGYRYRRKRDGQHEETPDKNEYSHCFVGDTLVLMADMSSKPIADIRVGEEVMTPVGPRRVLATMSREVRQTLVLTMSDGTVLECTHDHPFMINGRRVRADALQYGQQLSTVKDAPWSRNTNPKNLTGSRSTASPAGTTRPTTCGTAGYTCTDTSGSSTTDRYRTATRYTTSTTTGRTTLSKIWSACARAIICRTTAGFAVLKGLSKLRPTWQLFDRQRALGTGPRKVASGTGNTPPTSGSRESNLRTGLAPIAEKTSLAQPGMQSEGSVRWPASQQPGERAGSMMSPESAQSATRSSELTSTRSSRLAADSAVMLLHRRSADVTRVVYDLTVDDAHVFYANGILVSNCHDALQYGVMLIEGGVDYVTQPPRVREVQRVSMAGWT